MADPVCLAGGNPCESRTSFLACWGDRLSVFVITSTKCCVLYFLLL